MPYLYHIVPQKMVGTKLYPLNLLGEIDEMLHREYAKRYDWRPHVMKQRIPLLGNCRWNDVLFLTAVHPADFRKAYESTGLKLYEPMRAFQFDADLFDATNTAVITGFSTQPGQLKVMELFEKSHLETYARIPEETYAYWLRQKELNIRPLLFVYIPHVLYRGTLETAGVSIVEG